MGKHSKNQASRGFHSRNEMEKARANGEYGTLEIRLGSDSQLPFGHCALSLSLATKDPVVTPSGHIYSREAILQYLMTKMQQLKEAREEYENFIATKEDLERSKMKQDKEAEIEDFLSTNSGLKSHETTSNSKRKIDSKTIEAEKRQKKNTDNRTAEEKVDELKKTSYWLPQFQPTTDQSEMKKPPSRPSSPLSGKPLKSKQLVPIQFELDPSDDKQILCALSKNPIVHQQCILIKPAGKVILESCFDELVKPTMMCPFTNKALKDRDIIKLVRSGSSFAQNSKVTAKKYKPNLM